MFFLSGRSQRTQAGTGRTCRLHAEAPGLELSPQASFCEAPALWTAPLCLPILFSPSSYSSSLLLCSDEAACTCTALLYSVQKVVGIEMGSLPSCFPPIILKQTSVVCNDCVASPKCRGACSLAPPSDGFSTPYGRSKQRWSSLRLAPQTLECSCFSSVL